MEYKSDLFIDLKYANLLSARLERFSVTSNNPFGAKFRCPLCGDSAKDPRKTRGHFFQHRNDSVMFKCFNCGESTNIAGLLKRLDTVMFDEYKVEAFVETSRPRKRTAQPVFHKTGAVRKSSPLAGIPKISALPVDHPARAYLDSRMVDTSWHSRIFYSENYSKFVNSLIPGKMKERSTDKRVVFPLTDRAGHLVGIQGRSIDPSDKVRYSTIMIEESPKGFNVDRVDTSKDVLVFEGVFDAMVLDNSVAVLSSGLSGIQSVLPRECCVLVPDIDVRNREVMKAVSGFVDQGFRVAMLPDSLPGKDFNEMLLSGMTREEIRAAVEMNTFQGLAARIHFNTWSKIKI